MRKYLILIVAALVCVSVLDTGVVAASDAVSEGTRIMRQVYNRPDGSDFSSRGYMELTEQGHSPRVRKMYNYRLDRGNGEVWSLIRFTLPKDIQDVGLLTLDYPGDETDQWIFLPELGRARRISSSRKGGRFVGSDYYYEDLQDREPELDRHAYRGEEKLGGALCKVVESTPVDSENSVYSKRVSWIHPRTLLPLQVDFYQEGSDTPVKRLKVYRIGKVQGYWTVLETGMTDLETGHNTRMKIEKIIYDRGLTSSLFSRQVLTDPGKESRYRP